MALAFCPPSLPAGIAGLQGAPLPNATKSLSVHTFSREADYRMRWRKTVPSLGLSAPSSGGCGAQKRRGGSAVTAGAAEKFSASRESFAGPGIPQPNGDVLAGVVKFSAAALIAGALSLSTAVDPASARLEGVNKPELLPQGQFTRVIDTGGFLSSGQVQRLSEDLGRLEQDTGFKLRVLSQSYPNTPGLAIREYWGVDDDTIVFVADPTFKNILNFNVGATVDLRVPRSFWSRLAGKYGNIFFWRENGEDAAIEAAVTAIDSCLREEPGPRQCAEIR